MRKEKEDLFYMSIAKHIALFSHCKKSKVGCVIVGSDFNLHIGYNGTVSGQPNDCEDCDGISHDTVLHAESNALAKCTQSTSSSNGATMYVTLSPCVHCAKQIIQSRIARVVYLEKYRCDRGIGLLKAAGVVTEQYQSASDLQELESIVNMQAVVACEHMKT